MEQMIEKAMYNWSETEKSEMHNRANIYLWSENSLSDMRLSESNRANDQESDAQLERNRKERNAQ